MHERKEKRHNTGDAAVRPRDGFFPKGSVVSADALDALARMRHSTRCSAMQCDPMRRIVIVSYWRRAVLVSLSRVSLAKPTSKAAIPATSASEAARRAACRKWIHRCRVLINQISTTISQRSCDDPSSSGVSLSLIHSPLDFSVDLLGSGLFKRLRKSSNSHKLSLG